MAGVLWLSAGHISIHDTGIPNQVVIKQRFSLSSIDLSLNPIPFPGFWNGRTRADDLPYSLFPTLKFIGMSEDFNSDQKRLSFAFSFPPKYHHHPSRLIPSQSVNYFVQSIINSPPTHQFVLLVSQSCLNDLYSRHRSFCRACSRCAKGQCSPFRNCLRRTENCSHLQFCQCILSKFTQNSIILDSWYVMHVN